MTVSPNCLPVATAVSLTTPGAPCTTSAFPARKRARFHKPTCEVPKTTGKDARCAQDIAAGIGTQRFTLPPVRSDPIRWSAEWNSAHLKKSSPRGFPSGRSRCAAARCRRSAASGRQVDVHHGEARFRKVCLLSPSPSSAYLAKPAVKECCPSSDRPCEVLLFSCSQASDCCSRACTLKEFISTESITAGKSWKNRATSAARALAADSSRARVAAASGSISRRGASQSK